MGDGKFAPAEEVTRAQFIAMIARALQLDLTPSSTSFKDVKVDAWFSSYVAAAVKAGLVQGSGNGKFEPSREVTREEMAIMIANALKYAGKDQQADKDALSAFKDKAKIGSYAQNAVAQLVQSGVLNGMGDGTFAPKGLATRAQAAVILDRMLGQVS